MPKRSNGFDKNPNRARDAGRKSKRTGLGDLREARAMHAVDFENSIYKYFTTELETLKKIYIDQKTPVRDLIVIKILIAAIEKADFARLNFLLERTIGKVKDIVDHNVNSGGTFTFTYVDEPFRQMPDLVRKSPTVEIPIEPPPTTEDDSDDDGD